MQSSCSEYVGGTGSVIKWVRIKIRDRGFGSRGRKGAEGEGVSAERKNRAASTERAACTN